MTSLSDLKGQSLSTIVCDFFICPSCGIIDRDDERGRRGHRCSHCLVESERARLAFDANIMCLVDLAQVMFHSEAHPSSQKDFQLMSRDVGTLLIICSLREALLTNFFVVNLLAKKVERQLIERLLNDNRSTNQRLNKLFPSVVGVKWKQAIESLPDKHPMNYSDVSSLMEEAAKERNNFLHEGSPWRISRDLPRRCIDSLFVWMSLFVALHNQYTQPFWGVRGDAAAAPGP